MYYDGYYDVVFCVFDKVLLVVTTPESRGSFVMHSSLHNMVMKIQKGKYMNTLSRALLPLLRESVYPNTEV